MTLSYKSCKLVEDVKTSNFTKHLSQPHPLGRLGCSHCPESKRYLLRLNRKAIAIVKSHKNQVTMPNHKILLTSKTIQKSSIVAAFLVSAFFVSKKKHRKEHTNIPIYIQLLVRQEEVLSVHQFLYHK